MDKLCEQCRIYLFKLGKALRRPDTLWKFYFFIIKRDKKDGTKSKRDDNDVFNILIMWMMLTQLLTMSMLM